jgi:hypothetical protein
MSKERRAERVIPPGGKPVFRDISKGKIRAFRRDEAEGSKIFLLVDIRKNPIDDAVAFLRDAVRKAKSSRKAFRDPQGYLESVEKREVQIKKARENWAIFETALCWLQDDMDVLERGKVFGQDEITLTEYLDGKPLRNPPPVPEIDLKARFTPEEEKTRFPIPKKPSPVPLGELADSRRRKKISRKKKGQKLTPRPLLPKAAFDFLKTEWGKISIDFNSDERPAELARRYKQYKNDAWPDYAESTLMSYAKRANYDAYRRNARRKAKARRKK